MYGTYHTGKVSSNTVAMQTCIQSDSCTSTHILVVHQVYLINAEVYVKPYNPQLKHMKVQEN